MTSETAEEPLCFEVEPAAVLRQLPTIMLSFQEPENNLMSNTVSMYVRPLMIKCIRLEFIFISCL